MVYITGDTHGNIRDIIYRCQQNDITKNDILIILGDVGANFYLNKRDREFKYQLKELGTTFFCIQGNHEERPQNIPTYLTKEWNGGIVFYEETFPNILFAKDGEIYTINGKKCFVCGGAYSVDKYFRALRGGLYSGAFYPDDIYPDLEKLKNGINIPVKNKKRIDNFLNTVSPKVMFWFKDEQPSDEIKKVCEKNLEKSNWKVDAVFTHTSPEKFEPTEMFLEGLNQDLIDKTTEKWLDKIEGKLDYGMWYAGHYHTDKEANEKFQFLFRKVLPF